MKIVYYLAVHHKPRQFAWLFHAIYTAEDIFLVHVDKKASLEDFNAIREIAAGRSNVVFLDRRTVNWAGWSQVGAELAAMRFAVRQIADWDYFINLSGNDYPIKRIEEIRATLVRSSPLNFIRAWDFDAVREVEPEDPHLRREMSIEVGRHVRRLGVRLPRGSRYLRFKGSQWHMLTRGFCEWLVNSRGARRAARWMRFSYCPDETFFQTAIMSSPFAEMRAEDCGRFFEFPGPRTLTLQDLPRLSATDDLFGRKFDEDVDSEVLRVLAARLGLATPAIG